MKLRSFALGAPLWAFLAAAAAAATVTVVVKETKVRKRPQFYAPAMASARLGDRLETSGGAENGWVAVSSNGRDGFIHQSAVTAKRFHLSSGGSVGGSGPSAEEVTLAGKGFNEQVEKTYRSKNGGLDFAAVDAMEERAVSDAALARFMKDGGLAPAEGE